MRIVKKILVLPIFLFLFGCPSDDEIEQEKELENVNYEVLLFEFTPDTGNNSSRLQYEIKFNNPNDISIKGFHKITLNIDGLISSNIATDSSPCYIIGANDSCLLSFDEEESFDIGKINSIKLVSVEYHFDNK